MEVETVEDVAKVDDSRFHTQTFVFCLDYGEGKSRYDYLPDFDSREPDKIVAGTATYLVDERSKIIAMNSRSLKPSSITFEQAKNLQGNTRFCSPFVSVLVGFSGFSDTAISMLATDQQSIILKRFVFEERREDPKGMIVLYKISAQSPVFAEVRHTKAVGEMPTSFKTLNRLPDGKWNEIGRKTIDWAKLGTAWVPVSQKSEMVSYGGGPEKGGYAIKCSVKYTWTTKLPEKLWLAGNKAGDFLLTGNLVDHIYANQNRLK